MAEYGPDLFPPLPDVTMGGEEAFHNLHAFAMLMQRIVRQAEERGQHDAQRVALRDLNDAREQGYAAGLDKARKAVAALPKHNINAGSLIAAEPFWVINREQALAAISALRGQDG